MYNGQFGVQSDGNGLYYMHARYYNADIKRFVNQDILTGTIDSSQSLNRYAYVEGNPVSFLDPFGLDKNDNEQKQDYIETLIHWTMHYYGLDKGTTSVGAQGSFSPGIFDFNAQLGVTIDKNGNFALQFTPGVNVTAGAGISAGPYYAKTNADSIDDLRGEGINIGGTVAGEMGLAIDFNAIPIEEKNYYGITISPVAGAAAEVHAGSSYTMYIVEGNIYDIYKKYFKKIFS